MIGVYRRPDKKKSEEFPCVGEFGWEPMEQVDFRGSEEHPQGPPSFGVNGRRKKVVAHLFCRP